VQEWQVKPAPKEVSQNGGLLSLERALSSAIARAEKMGDLIFIEQYLTTLNFVANAN